MLLLLQQWDSLMLLFIKIIYQQQHLDPVCNLFQIRDVSFAGQKDTRIVVTLW